MPSGKWTFPADCFLCLSSFLSIGIRVFDSSFGSIFVGSFFLLGIVRDFLLVFDMSSKVTLSYLLAALFLFLSLAYHHYGPLDLARILSRSRPTVPVLFAVSTRPDRLRQRRQVRATWKNLVQPGQARLAFFGGERLCEVDPYWRLRPGSCRHWSVFVPASINEGFPVRPCRFSPSRLGAGPPVDGVGFRLKFPVSVTQLGLAKTALKHFLAGLPPEEQMEVDPAEDRSEVRARRHLFRNLTVDLLDPLTEDVYVSANFSAAELVAGQADDGYIYAPVREDTYGRHFEGAVRVRNHKDLYGPNGANSSSLSSLWCSVIWNKMFGEDGVVPVESMWSSGRSRPVSLSACPLVSFVYHIPDMSELRQMVNSRETQNKCQRNKNRNLASKIVEELEDYDDLHLVPGVLDTEEERPRALLAFLQTALERHDFEYLVVTDDESFLAADQIVASVLGDFVPADAWRSAFRRRVPVPHFGEFPETRYQGAEYPALPSEAGSVLSRGLVEHLVANADRLVPQKDLSSSLGVWLAPFAPTLIEDGDFSLDNRTCSNGLRAFGPVPTEAQFKALWHNYSKCRRLCSCPPPPTQTSQSESKSKSAGAKTTATKN